MQMNVKIKIPELIERTGLSLREIGRRTNIPHSVLSAMSRQKRQFVYLAHILLIAETFNITDMRDIIDFCGNDD
jgi:putative transcriptional regulator